MFAVHWPHSIRPLKLWNADSTTRNAIEFTAQKLLFEFENQPIRCSLQKLWPSVWCVGRHLTLLERLFPITLAYNGENWNAVRGPKTIALWRTNESRFKCTTFRLCVVRTCARALKPTFSPNGHHFNNWLKLRVFSLHFLLAGRKSHSNPRPVKQPSYTFVGRRSSHKNPCHMYDGHSNIWRDTWFTGWIIIEVPSLLHCPGRPRPWLYAFVYFDDSYVRWEREWPRKKTLMISIVNIPGEQQTERREFKRCFFAFVVHHIQNRLNCI